MIEILFHIFTYLLAAYGAMFLIFSIINSIRQRINFEYPGIKLILLVKNQQEVIEGIIRYTFTIDFLRNIMPGRKLTVLDMGSTDETIVILRKLEETFGHLEVLEENDKEKIFTGFE
jgi:hypothetical protein